MKEKVESGLIYPKFSIVYMQIFELSDVFPDLGSGFIIEEPGVKKDLDDEIFNIESCATNCPIRRYSLPFFTIEIKLDKKRFPNKLEIKGTIEVELSIFFDRTAIITYALKVDNDADLTKTVACKSTVLEGSEKGAINTDQLIELIAMSLSGENWGTDESDEQEDALNDEIARVTKISVNERSTLLELRKKERANQDKIRLETSKVKISNVKLDSKGIYSEGALECISNNEREEFFTQNPFDEICNRYESAVKFEFRNKSRANGIKRSIKEFFKCGDEKDLSKSQRYVYVDIWESVDSADGSLQKFEKEEDIISAIRNEHREELIGLMTQYPYEWPYRDPKDFEDICGGNVAIDTDDLILLNSNICVVFGTYGRRAKGSPVNWTKHLSVRNNHHISWPEYMIILQMILAKKYTISLVRELVLDSISASRDKKSVGKDYVKANANLELKAIEILLKLDAVNYSRFMSHKIMFDRTIERLEIERDEEKLKGIMDRVDGSLDYIDKSNNLRKSIMLNVVLTGISIASLFEVILSEPSSPIFEHLLEFKFNNLITGEGEVVVGNIFIVIALLLLLSALVTLLIMSVIWLCKSSFVVWLRRKMKKKN